MQNYSISPRPLDQHPVVQIRVCTVCTGDEFALDPLTHYISLTRHLKIHIISAGQTIVL